MYSPFALSLKFLRYLATSANGSGHGTHSPFVYDFITKVLNDKTNYPEYEKIEALRKRLEKDETPIPVEDYGAGSVNKATSKSIAAITRDSSKNRRYAQLLFRIARFYQPEYQVELGTAAGISSAYLASGAPSSVIITAEGNYALAGKARSNLDALSLNHIKIVTGNFNNTLPQILGSIPHLDLAFVDGNHRRTPTINYFNQLLKLASSRSMIIFDDVHWSKEMEEAWEEIKSHPQAMLTIDLFFMGIVFIRPEFKVKQHFTIRF